MYNSVTYGTVIKELRNDRFLSQGDLAKDICSQGMLSRIENNEVVPNVLVMQQLCQRLNVSVNYVLTLEDGPEGTRNQWLELLNQFKQSKEFEKLAETVNKLLKDETAFTTKQEKQEFAYYHATSLIQMQDNFDEAITVLQEGLALTYYRNKHDVTDMEVMILSEIGQAYYQQGKFEIGVTYLKRSASQFYSNISNRNRIELIKVFYNAASALIDLKCNDDALEYVEQGILWCQKKKTYYRLADLFFLKGMILQAKGLLTEADEIVEIAITLENMAKKVDLVD